MKILLVLALLLASCASTPSHTTTNQSTLLNPEVYTMMIWFDSQQRVIDITCNGKPVDSVAPGVKCYR